METLEKVDEILGPLRTLEVSAWLRTAQEIAQDASPAAREAVDILGRAFLREALSRAAMPSSGLRSTTATERDIIDQALAAYREGT